MTRREDHPKLVRVADCTERFKNIYEIRLAPTPPNGNCINSHPHHMIKFEKPRTGLSDQNYNPSPR